MLVLDSLEQYVKYEVEPPITLPFHSQYLKVMSKKKTKKDNKLTKKMAFVKQLWDRRLNWWRSCVVNIADLILCRDYPLDDPVSPQILHHIHFNDMASQENHRMLHKLMCDYQVSFYQIRSDAVS